MTRFANGSTQQTSGTDNQGSAVFGIRKTNACLNFAYRKVR